MILVQFCWLGMSPDIVHVKYIPASPGFGGHGAHGFIPESIGYDASEDVELPSECIPASLFFCESFLQEEKEKLVMDRRIIKEVGFRKI